MIELHASRASCDRDDRLCSFCSVRQHDRHAIASTYTEASERANRIVHTDPERAIGHRAMVECQDRGAVGRRSPVISKKIREARKDAATGLVAPSAVAQW